jgi:uncharacterized protein YndB with AHSA1/START domain
MPGIPGGVSEWLKEAGCKPAGSAYAGSNPAPTIFMRAHHVHVEHDFAKPPERIFAYLAEHENLAAVFGAKVTRLRDGEDGQRNGVGSRRRLNAGPLPAFEETVTEFAPSRRIVYRITKGSPLRGHVGIMEFTPTAAGTHFVYDIRIASPIPGLAPLVRAVLTRSITRSLPGVERDA